MVAERSGDQNAKFDMTARSVLPRRALLRGAALGSGALALGAVGAASAAARVAMPAVLRSSRTYRVAYVGGTCEAFTYAAAVKNLWAREGITVELARLAPPTVIDALSTGKVDAAGGILYNWLKPIEQGVDIRIAAGLQGGCLRLIVGSNTGIKQLTDLKGKTIGTDSIGGSGMNFFSVMLVKAGISPKTDVSWRVYPPPQFGTALERGEIQAIASFDPFPFLLVEQGKAIELATNMTGMYNNRFCCVGALHGSFAQENPKAAAGLIHGWMNGSRYVGGHLHEVAMMEVAHKFVPIKAATVERLLSSYTWKPSATTIKEEIALGARDFKLTGFLDKRTDPAALAERAYIDIFKMARAAG